MCAPLLAAQKSVGSVHYTPVSKLHSPTLPRYTHMPLCSSLPAPCPARHANAGPISFPSQLKNTSRVFFEMGDSPASSEKSGETNLEHLRPDPTKFAERPLSRALARSP